MPGTMSEVDLVSDLKASLQDAKNAFTAADDADYKRHLKTAALDFGRKRRRTLYGSLALIADQARYAAPASFLAFKSALWGISPVAAPKPWERGYPGRLPDVYVVEEADGTKKLELRPAPTAAQISVLGADYRYYYYAGHVVAAAAAGTTIFDGERQILLLRAQAEAVRELALRNINKPTTLRDGVTNAPRNGTPAYLFEALMREFEAA